jgi:hypothetical protein
MNADRSRRISRRRPVPDLCISPFDRGRNGAGVLFVRNIKALDWQTTVTVLIDRQRLFPPVANLA